LYSPAGNIAQRVASNSERRFREAREARLRAVVLSMPLESEKRGGRLSKKFFYFDEEKACSTPIRVLTL
jgi:hypothetical protein